MKELSPQLEDLRARTSYFERIVLLAIVVSSVLLGVYTHNMPFEQEERLDSINDGLSYLFIVEVVAKIFALGPRIWMCNPVNGFDLFLVLASLPELVIPSGAVSLNFMRLLRLLRLLRSVKLFVRIESVRVLMAGLEASSKELASYIMLFSLFYFLSTLSGMQLFGGKTFSIARPASGANFDTLGSAAVSALQLILGSDWASILFSLMYNNGAIAVVYVVPVLLFGKYLLINLLTAIFISRLPADNYLVAVEQSRLDLRVNRGTYKKVLRAVELGETDPQEASIRSVAASETLHLEDEQKRPPLLQRIAGAIVTWHSHYLPLISFDNIVLLLVIISMIAISLETYDGWPSAMTHTLGIVDNVLTFAFLSELLLQVCFQRSRWPTDAWNWLDFLIVISALVSFILTTAAGGADGGGGAINATLSGGNSQLSSTKSIRTLRVLRPLRVLKRFPRLKSTVTTLLRSIPATVGVLAMALFIWYLMAILGMQLLGGVFRECSDGITPIDQCADEDRVKSLINFDSLGSTMLALLSMFKLDNWPLELHRGVSNMDNPLMSIVTTAYFVAFVFFGSTLVTSLYIAILCSEYKNAHAIFMTEEQAQWFEAQKQLAVISRVRREKFLKLAAEHRRSRWAASKITRMSSSKIEEGLKNAKADQNVIPKHVYAIFQEFDRDGNGTINTFELDAALKYLGFNLSAALVKDVLHSYSRDGKLTIQEFGRFIHDASSLAPGAGGGGWWSRCKLVVELSRKERHVRPSSRHGRRPEDANTWLYDTSWFIVHGHPPHQLLETSICVLLTVNWLFALARHAGQPERVGTIQNALSFLVASVLGAEAVLKIVAYSPLGYLSYFMDVFDGLLAAAQITSFALLFNPSFASQERQLLHFGPALVAMYRVARLLHNWRFFRESLLTTRALLSTLRLSLPALMNVMFLLLLMIYICASLHRISSRIRLAKQPIPLADPPL